jgi:hypothetical protein
VKPGLILQHGATAPPGLFGEWKHAFALFDGFWKRAQRAERRDP